MRPLWWHDAKALVIVMLGGTVCAILLLTIVVFAVRGPDHVPPEARAKMYELISFLLGLLAGYIMRGNGAAAPP